MAKRRSSRRSRRGKRSRQSRRARGKRSPPQRPTLLDTSAHVPSAATLFRFHVLDPETMDLIDKAVSFLKPLLWARDGKAVRRIQRAETAEELLELLPLASGLGEPAWRERMGQFEAEVVPLISERLKTARDIQDEDLQDMTLDALIGELRRRGDAGAKVLLECFDVLSDYGQSLACVALGLLGEQAAADRIWRFYQRVVRNRRETYFVGALWGLIDLADERAGGALADLLAQRQYFYELFGFLSLAGDVHSVDSLADEIFRRPDDDKLEPMMALIGVAHRAGRDAMVAELEKHTSPDETREDSESLADELLAQPLSDVQEYFELFYRGLTLDDLMPPFPERT